MTITKTDIIDRIVKIGTLDPPDRNNVSAYLPYRNKGADFDYEYVAGALVGHQHRLKLSPKFTHEGLEAMALAKISKKVGGDDLTSLLKDIYFAEGQCCLAKLAPKFLLLNTKRRTSAGSKHLENLFKSFVSEKCELDECSYNFIEKSIVEIFDGFLDITKKSDVSELPYLPFIAESFSADASFLASKPGYFLEKVEDFLALYTFLYCSQLAANIRGWKRGEPTSKPHYFIIDTEKCSGERKAAHCYRGLSDSLANVFPILTMLDEINGKSVLGEGVPTMPLWMIVDYLKEASDDDQKLLIPALQSYIDKFAGPEVRGEDGKVSIGGRHLKERTGVEYEGLLGKVDLLFQYAMDQFDQDRELNPTSKHEMKTKYKKPFELEVAKHFVQARGRLGKVLVINQDYLLMLTNLVIADSGKLRLQEILTEFEKRGVYFDKQSHLSLISFYERIGNIERMSDSGDAVYVKSTV